MVIKINYTSSDVYVSTSVSPVYVVVNYSAVNNGGGAVWGGITGTLSDQTDLQNALNAKFDDPTGTTSQYLRGDGSLATFPSLTGFVPYTGATGQVDLGNHDLKVQGLTIGKGNNALVNNTALGHSTLLTITTGNFNTAVGYEALRNTTTGQYNTAVGQSSLFSNTTGGQNTALGLNALLSNTTGSSNVAVGLDTLQHITTGSSNTAIGYNAGSHITGGSTPNTTATNSVFIGRDSKAGADGQTNQIVIGQNAVGNGSNTATFGNTATTANYFTGSINGGSFVKSGGTSSQFLKADGSVDSTTYVGGSGATGQVAYWNGTSSQTGSNNLTYSGGYLTNTNTSTDSAILIIRPNQTTYQSFIGVGTVGAYSPSNLFWSFGLVPGNQDFNIQSYNGTTVSSRIKIFASTGNVSLNAGVTTDGGQRLQVMGDAFIKGSGATSGTTGLVVQDSAGTTTLNVRNDGQIFMQANRIFNTDSIKSASSNLSLESFNSALHIRLAGGVNNATGGVVIGNANNITLTTGVRHSLAFDDNFTPTSGTSVRNYIYMGSTINQTGGANGITRGLYVNPTLTAAADWRSIEWSNNSGWGLYGAGTANNYLAGKLVIGTTSVGTYALDVVGGFRATSNTISDFVFTGANANWTSISINNTAVGGRSWQIGSSASNGTVGNSNFFIYDSAVGSSPRLIINSSGYLGINKSSAGYPLDMSTATEALGALSSGGSVLVSAHFGNGFYIGKQSTTGAIVFTMFSQQQPFIWAGWNGTTIAERMTLTAAGRLLLGTTTESTFLLDVNGTARVSGNMTFSAGTTSQGTLINGGSATRYTSDMGINTNAIYTSSSLTTNDVIASYVGGGAVANIYFYVQTSGYIGARGALRLGASSGTDIVTPITNTWLNVAAGTTARSQINLASSTAPTSPNNGDIWFDGTDLKMRIGGVTKTFTLV